MFNYDILNRRPQGSPQSYLKPKSVFDPEYDAFWEQREAMTKPVPLSATERRAELALQAKLKAELEGKPKLPTPATKSGLSDFESLGLDTSTLQDSYSEASSRPPTVQPLSPVERREEIEASGPKPKNSQCADPPTPLRQTFCLAGGVSMRLRSHQKAHDATS